MTSRARHRASRRLRGNNACDGCDGIPNSGKVLDLCGVCGGSNACVGCDGVAIPKYVDLGGDAVNGVFYMTHYSSATTANIAAAQTFIAKFQKAYGKVPDAYNAEAYDAITAALLAIDNALLGEPMQGGPPSSSSSFYVYVSDVDSMYKRATGAGAKSVSPPTDQFWGDRMATVTDSFGNTWSLATHKEDPTPEEMAKRMAAANR